MLCILVRGGTSKKGHQKGHKWPFSVCVNLKKDPYRHLRPRTNMHSTIELELVGRRRFFLRAFFRLHSDTALFGSWDQSDSVGVSLTSPSPKYCVIMKIFILTIIFVLVHGATILAQEEPVLVILNCY